ncbi:OmpL47-type beta-barrel domain-containing protein [Treponema bryantii]|uniref:OmpL47-type beta-barrel domain-containing protein n=1 Tax=Treponema bryantii TaxID=163 RepID=UPI002B3113B1|nr:hypothetical protein TRBR_15410 [Treponema bryantii]
MKLKKFILSLFLSIIFILNSYAGGSSGGGGSSGPKLVRYTDSLTSVNNLSDTAFSSYTINIIGVYDNDSESNKASVTLTANNGLLKFNDLSSKNNSYYRKIYFKGTLTVSSDCTSTVTKANGVTQQMTTGYQVQNNDKVFVSFPTGESTFTYQFIQDNTQPNIEEENKPKQYYNLSNKTFSFTAEDTGCGINTASYKIKCSALGIDNNSNSIELGTDTKDGIYEFIYSVSDYVGNENKQTITITFDKTNPVVTFSQKPSLVCKEAVIQASVTEANPDILEYYYTYNNKEEHGSCNGVVTLKQPGEYSNFYFKAIDKTGNEGKTKQTIDFKIDTVAPVITVKEDYKKEWTNSPVTIVATATDNYGYDYSSWKYSIDNDTKISFSKQEKFEKPFDLDTGIHEIYIYVSDNVKNEAKSKKITLKIDKEKPNNLVITNSCNNSWTKASSVTVSVKAKDSHSGISHYLYSFDNKKWEMGSSVTVSEECNKTVYFKAVDNAGNISDVSSSKIMIDTSKPNPPTLTNSANEDWTKANSVTVSANSTDGSSGISHYLYSFDKSTWKKGSSVTVTEECNKDVYFKCVDNAGNESNVAKSSIKIDRTKPEITIETPIPSRSQRYKIEANSTDSASGITSIKYEIYKDGKLVKLSEKKQQTSITLEWENNGTYTIKFTAFDKAGNEFSTKEYTIEVDNIGPVLTFKSVPNPLVWVKSANIEATTNSPDVLPNTNTWIYYYQYENGTENSGKGRKFTLTDHGKVKVWFSVEDDCGNTGFSEKKEIKIDTKAPVFNTSFTQQGNKITATATDADSGLNNNSYKWSLDDKTYYTGNEATLNDGTNQIVYFTVEDNCGNRTLPTTYKIELVDTTPPKMNFTPDSYNYKDKLTLKNISITDNITGVKTVEYYVDNNLLTRKEKVDSTIELDVWNFEPGIHNVWLKAYDVQGNSAESEKRPFTIDRTIPSITNNKFIYESNEITDDDFIGKNELTVEIEASDDSGTIKSIHYGVSATEGVEPENWKVQAEHTIILNNAQNALQNGINFIYVKAEDIAGNCSVPLIKAIIKDTGKPGKALISSTTHKFANDVKDVELNTTASFVLKPTRTSGAGIKGYRYSLEEGVSETNTRVITSGTIESKSMEILDFEELADNKENEFYFLKVWCIGGNDLESDETIYSFRVDTTPPAGLYISLNPQVNYSNSYFYNDDVTNVSWNIPRDLTGIEKYELEITADGEKLYSADTKNTSAVINVKNLCKAKNLKAGKLDVQVTAYDYAKNSVEAARSFNFDFEAPVFENEINIEEVEGNPVARNIIWGTITDAQSECDQIVIEYRRLDEDNAKSNRVVLNAEDSKLPESYTISTFRNDTAYFLSVTGYDKAGNTAKQEKWFAVGDAVIPPVIKSEYRELSNGIIITGIKEKRSDGTWLTDGKLILPDNIRVYAINTENGNEEKERITELIINDETLIADDNSIPSALFNSSSQKYETQCGQFVFENQNFIYEAENGIALTDVNVEVPVENKVKDTETVHFERIELGYPNALYINAVSNELDTPVTVKTGGFDIQNVNKIEIEGEAYRLNNSRSSIFFEPKNINIVTASQDKEIPLTNTYTDSSFNSVYGDIDGTNLELVLNDVTYIIKKAGISGNTINIYEAEVELPEGYTPSKLNIKNFSIDDESLEVTQGKYFEAESLTVTENGITVIENGIVTIGKDGKLVVSGILNIGTEYGAVEVTDLEIKNDGLDIEKGCNVSSYSFVLYGYNVSVTKAIYSKDKLLIKEGEIEVYGSKFNIEDLGIDTSVKDSVYKAGTAKGNSSFNSGYTAEQNISDLEIDTDGVFAKELKVPVFGTGEAWNLKHVLLRAAGTVSVTTTDEYNTQINGYDIQTKKTTFNGKEIVVENGIITNANGFKDNKLNIANVTLNSKALVSGGETAQNEVYTLDGWNVVFDKLSLANSGLTGKATVQNEDEDYEIEIAFESFTVKADGSFATGKVIEEDSYIIKNEYYFELSNAVINQNAQNNKYEVVSSKPKLVTGENESIELSKLYIDSEGNLRIDTSKNKYTFTTSNGCEMDIEETSFDGEQFYLKGSGKPGAFTNYSTSDVTLTLSPAMKVSSEYADIDYNYTYKGWNIKGHGVQYKKNYIEIVSNVVTFNGTEIEVGDLLFSMDGTLLGENIAAQDKFISIISNQSKITETRFSEEGLFATVNIALPETFKNSILAYNSVCLHPDGTYESETVISHAEIPLGKVTFNFDYVSLSKKGLSIGYAAIKVPELDNLSIELKGLSISSKGKVELKGCVTSPFRLWNMTFAISKLSIDEDKIDFKGTIRLPESLPGILSGRTVGIRNFSIGLDGKVREFDARLEGKYTIPFLDSFALAVTSVGVAYKNESPWIMMEEASLILPSTYCIDNISITDVAFNPLKGEFDFDTIKANTDLSTTISGIKFNLTSVSITKAMTIGFSGNAKFVGDDLPDFIKGKSVELKQFEIKSDGNIGNIDIQLNGLDGKIAPSIEVVELRDGSVAVRKEDGSNSLYLSVSGALEFTNKAPAFLLDANGKGGVALRIENFTIDASRPCITELDAYLSRKVNDKWTRDVKEINFDPNLGGTQLNDVYVAFYYNGEKDEGSVTLSGGLILPDSLPEGIGGTEVRLNKFEIALDGQIKAFAAEYNLEKTAIGSIELRDVHLGAEYKDEEIEYSVATTLLLPKEKFIQGIGGSTTKASLVFTASELKSVDAEFRLGDISIADGLKVNGVFIGVQKHGSAALQFSVGGRAVLPETLPEGLKGTEIAIRKFVINQYGEIEDLDIGARNINALLFDQLQLSGGSVVFSKGTQKDEFLIDVGGILEFSQNSSVPDGLKEACFAINKLQVSTKSGLVAFDAGLNEGIQFEVLGGVKVYVNQLFFSNEGFRVSAGAGLNFPSVDFGNVRFDASISMSWDGKITAFNGGLGELNVQIAGFKGSIKELYVGKFDNADSDFMVSLKECRLTLPGNFGSMGGSSFALKNATFDPNTGDFNGEFEVPSLKTEIAGFKLVLDAPTINFKEFKIGFSRAYLELPEFFNASGANVSIYDIVVTAQSGLSIGGAGFTLPDFKLGEFGFKNIGAEFRMQDGTYFISGHGGIILPNVGEIEAALCFTEVSEIYPIGLKHAYFSFEAATGIPLGATGLCLSGIRGGLGYGYPDEVPEKYQKLFGEKGPRVQLGLTVKDTEGGHLAKVTADAWIDIEKITWILEGKATILSGTLNITAEAAAIITNNCFATGMKVNIKFVRGSIELYIFDQNGTLKFSGAGEAKFGMPKGELYDGWLISIPPCDIWLGGFGVMFGDFTNGKRGFLGYIDIEFCGFNWGRIGAFVGTGGLDLRVSSYDICRPDGISFKSMNRAVRGPVVNTLDIASAKYTNTMLDAGGTIYKVTIPGGKSTQIKPSYASRAGRQNLLRGGETTQEEAPVKTSFVIGYLEGDPEFTVYSPSGKKFKAGDEGIDTQYIESGLLINIDYPEGGEWTISVDNMEEGTYELAVFGVEKIPAVTVEEPSSGVLNVTDSIYVSGYSSEKNKDVYIFASTDEYAPVVELGCLKTDSEGKFAGYVSTDNIADGEYIISARVVTNDDMYSPAGIASGKYNVNRSGLKLKAPANVYVTESEENRMKLLWTNTNGSRTAGYKLKTITDGKESEDNLGNISELYISNYQPGSNVSYSLCAYDEYGNESDYTDYVTYVVGEDNSENNKVYIRNKVIELTAKKGTTSECTVDVSYKNWKDEVSYVRASKVETSRDYNAMSTEEYLELVQSENKQTADEELPVEVSFEKNVQISKDGNSLKIYVNPSDTCAEGEYTVECEVANDNSPDNKDSFTLKITVENPSPVITAVYPVTVDGTKENEITIYGEGFVPGVKYYLGNKEVITVESEDENLFCRTLKLPVLTERGMYKVRVLNDKGEEAEYELGVIIPSYDVNLYTTELYLNKGQTGIFNISVSPFDGYEEDAGFSIEECSDQLSVELPVIPMNENGSINVNTQNAEEGDYKIVVKASSGKTFELTVHVTAEKILPVITSFNPYKLNKGCDASVMGYGFGDNGKLYLNDSELEVQSYSDSKIDFVVPADIEGDSVTIYVENENGKSEIVTKNVYEYSYTVRIPKDKYTLSGGESETVNIAVNGYATNVKLKAEPEAGAPLTVSLSKDVVSTNAYVEMQVTCNEDAEPGEYSIVITAEGNNINITKTVKVTVLSDMKIVTEKLAEAVLGVKYENKLEAETEGAQVIWKVSSGSLPLGIRLNSTTGVLEGTPSVSGEFSFTVKISKVDGTFCEKDLTLIVKDEIWEMNGKNGGNTNSVVSDIPSNSQEYWNAKLKESVANIYSNGSKVVVLTESGRMYIFSEHGKQLYDSTNIFYKKGFITSRYFYGITKNNVLEARTLEKGFLMWNRENVSNMTYNSSVLIAQLEENAMRIDPVNGTLAEELPFSLTDTNYVWNNTCLYAYTGNKLYGLYGTDKTLELEEVILKVSADSDGFVILTENKLYSYTSELELKIEGMIRNEKSCSLAISAGEIAVSNNKATVLYDRENLKVKHVYAGSSIAALANEKLVLADSTKLSVNNVYSGNEIWNVKGNITAVAMCNGKLFAADKNILRSYEGSSNTSAPCVTVTYSTPADGTDNWYKGLPVATIKADDKETYVESIWYRHNGGEFKPYTESFTVVEGDNLIEAYAFDSKGMKSDIVTSYIKTDITIPESSIYITPVKNEKGWYENDVTVRFTAYDSGSGVNRIVVNGNVYDKPLEFTKEGTYELTWYAVDNAGNKEEERTEVIQLDKYNPTTGINVRSDKGLSIIRLEAQDSYSGIDYIKYVLDNGNEKTYENELLIYEPGRHTIRWQVFDKSGRKSGLMTQTFVVQREDGIGNFMAFAELNGKKHEVKTPFSYDSQIYANDASDYTQWPYMYWERAYLHTLPWYVTGGDYIQYLGSDMNIKGKRTVEFYLKKNITLYMFAGPEMAVDSSWTLVEKKFGMQGHWYKDGWNVYKRKASKGEKIVVEVGSNVLALPVITAKQENN